MSARPKSSVGEIARSESVSVDFVKKWTDLGLIDCERGAGGRRMYDPIKAPQQVRAVKANNR